MKWTLPMPKLDDKIAAFYEDVLLNKSTKKATFRKYKKLDPLPVGLERAEYTWYGPLSVNGEEIDESDPAVKMALHIARQDALEHLEKRLEKLSVDQAAEIYLAREHSGVRHND